MNNAVSRWLGWVVAAIAVVIMVWQWNHYRTSQAALKERLARVEAESQAVASALEDLQQQIVALEKQSVKGVLRGANDAFLDGWSNLLGTVQEELDQIRERLGESLEEPPTGSPAPDGSGRQPSNPPVPLDDPI